MHARPQVLVPATVYLILATVYWIFDIGSLLWIELGKKGLCSLLAPSDITLPLFWAYIYLKAEGF